MTEPKDKQLSQEKDDKKAELGNGKWVGFCILQGGAHLCHMVVCMGINPDITE
jgi:hypothetical protein